MKVHENLRSTNKMKMAMHTKKMQINQVDEKRKLHQDKQRSEIEKDYQIAQKIAELNAKEIKEQNQIFKTKKDSYKNDLEELMK